MFKNKIAGLLMGASCALWLFGAAALSPIAAQTATSSAVYTVQPGENLFRIGLKFGLSVSALAQANGIVNPNIIYPGQKLILPGISPIDPQLNQTATSPTVVGSLPANPAPTTYVVQPGDNLFRIALKFNTSFSALAQLNGLINPNLVYIGETLKLPAGSPALLVTSTATPTATAALPTDQITPTDSGIPAATVAAPTAVSTSAATATPIPLMAAPATTVANNGPISKNVGFAVGVTISGGDPTALAGQVTDLGAAWVQYTVSWKAIEPTQGAPDFTALDAAVNAYSAANLNVLLTLTNAPDWARPVTAENGPPTDASAFAAFVGNAAARYKGKVRAYEIWSEPNLRRNWNGRPLSAVSYVELLRRARTAIKSADNGALVISAGLAPTGFYDGVNAINDRVFLKQAYNAGLATYADAIGAHPNGWANPPDATCCQASPGVTGWFNDRTFYFRDTLGDYRQIMKDSSDSAKFIWVTSFGWGANEGVAADTTVNDTSFGFIKFTSQAEQAQYLLRGFEIGRALGYVGPMFAYNLNACQAAGDPSGDQFYPCYYSLLDASGTPRPAYVALKAAQKH